MLLNPSIETLDVDNALLLALIVISILITV
jgi:hypothetical protein